MTAEELLKLVSENEPVYDEWWCLWCGAKRPDLEPSVDGWLMRPIPHDAECPYRLVVEYLAGVTKS